MARVLIVDDDAGVREYLEMLFEMLGHRTFTADDGAKGLAAVASGEVPGSPPGAGFNLIITDLNMPVMTGPEMIAALRGRGCAVPIILLTGVVDPPAIDGVRVLRKPFKLEVFEVMVAEEFGKNFF